MANREALLSHIAKHPKGLTFGEIQRFVVEANGLNYDEKTETAAWRKVRGSEGRFVKVTIMARKHRGYWCDNLLNGSEYTGSTRVGILPKFCTKKKDGRYILNQVGKRHLANA